MRAPGREVGTELLHMQNSMKFKLKAESPQHTTVTPFMESHNLPLS